MFYFTKMEKQSTTSINDRHFTLTVEYFTLSKFYFTPMMYIVHILHIMTDKTEAVRIWIETVHFVAFLEH